MVLEKRYDKRHINELGLKYIERYSLYQEYAARIRNLVQDLVEWEGVEFYAINGWAKTPSELLRALEAPEGDEAELDLVTVRVLLRFPEDVYKIERVVKAEFDVDDLRSKPSTSFTDPIRFGYPAVVYALALSEPRSELREWKKYAGLSFSLELRTMLQETWATILPKVRMSVGTAAEAELTHRLSLLSALLEQADMGFLALKNEVQSEALLVPRPSQEPRPVVAERTFTDDELYRFFKEDPALLSRWGAAALEAGFPAFSPDSAYLSESFKHLCQIFRAAGIDTLSEVKAFLADMEEGDRGLKQLQMVHSTFEGKDVSWRVDPFSALFLLVLNARWDTLKNKDLVRLNVKRGSDRISGVD